MQTQNAIWPESEARVFHTHFSSDPTHVGAVIEAAIQAISPIFPRDDDIQNLEIVLAETINNIIEHAYQDKIVGPIELMISRGERGLDFCFIDRGLEMPGHQVPAAKSHDLSCTTQDLPEGGFGWFLIHSLVQDLTYARISDENHLTFHYALPNN